jgi:RNA polymerase sigma-70 factor (ECF subfamily)
VDDATRAELQAVIREHHGWVVAHLVRTVRDLELAEDALSRAIEAALVQWPGSGIPDAPRAWLVRAARHKAIDELRRRATWAKKAEDLAIARALDADDADDDMPMRDDMLRLLFTCCHPALPEEARIALTLSAVVGLGAEEIARAFLVAPTTMAQRLVRAKRKIKDAGVPYRVPEADELPERLAGVRTVVYLVFNEGYSATSGDALVRHDLCRHAIRLASSLRELYETDAECTGLLALLLLHDSRRAARADAHGDLVLLGEQDRGLWDREQIAVGIELVTLALRRAPPGPFALQAAIAAVHAQAPSTEQTDWPQIVALYDRLFVLVPTPVVALNRAVALAFATAPAAGLAAVDALADELGGYFLFHAARGDLLRRCGHNVEAALAYETAASLCHNQAELRFLRRRAAEVRVVA